MKKLTVAALIIGAFLVYSFVHSQSNSAALAPKPSPDSVSETNTPAPTDSVPSVTARVPDGSGQVAITPTPTAAAASSTTTNSPTPTPTSASASGGGYKDGSYTGSVADAQWGYVQVKAVISQGKITDVQFLEYPSDRSRSQRINQSADPELINEAIQAQSAQVDIITGATDSSEAFMQSLANALSQATG
jgi:uncharacterized protein with FMN-binding domain